MIADDVNPVTNVVYVKVLVKPLVNLLWIAGIVFLLGSAVALWPDAREQRRLVDPPRTRTRVTTVALVLGVVLAAGAVLLVALPFLRDPTPVDDRLDAPSEADERQLALVEERDQALAALKELEFDHRTGKITDEDYRRDVGPLRRTAAAALRRLDDAGAPGGSVGGSCDNGRRAGSCRSRRRRPA